MGDLLGNHSGLRNEEEDPIFGLSGSLILFPVICFVQGCVFSMSLAQVDRARNDSWFIVHKTPAFF